MISVKQAEELMSFFDYDFLDHEWLVRHCQLEFDDYTHTVTIKIDNMNEQDYFNLKGIK